MRYAVTACVLVRRNDTWLLSVRSARAGYAPNMVGLIGGHLEVVDHGLDVLEAAARREVLEETGLDLTGVPLSYVESVFIPDDREPQVAVTFLADAPADAEASVQLPAELAEVGWWTPAQVADDPRCPPWLPELLRRADAVRR